MSDNKPSSDSPRAEKRRSDSRRSGERRSEDEPRSDGARGSDNNRPMDKRRTLDERRPAADAREEGDDRTWFDRFVERTHILVSLAPFFFICLVIVIAWMVSLPLWADLKAWQVAIHTVASVFTLLLLALIENAGRRADETAQEKLNVLAEAMSALMESHAKEHPELADAEQKLREAVGLEERH